MEYYTNVIGNHHLSIHKDFQVIHSSIAFYPCVPKRREGLADTSLVAREEVQRTVAEGCYLSLLGLLARVHTEPTIFRFYILGFLGKVPRVWQKCPFGLIVLSVAGQGIISIADLNFNGHSLPPYKISGKDGLRLRLVNPIFRPAFWGALCLTETGQLL